MELTDNTSDVIREDLESKIIISNEYTTNKLTLTHQSLTIFPSVIFKYQQITFIDLSWNNLSHLPDELASMPNLSMIYLYGNKFTEFPPVLLKIPKMFSIILEGNQISKLPPEVAKLSNLKVLVLAKNLLDHLPDHLSESSIDCLNISYNKFTHFPWVILQMRQLTHLDISGNKIEQLPDLRALENLNGIYMNDTPISDIFGLYNMELDTLSIKNIAAEFPQQDLIDLDIGQILIGEAVIFYNTDNGTKYYINKDAKLSTDELSGYIHEHGRAPWQHKIHKYACKATKSAVKTIHMLALRDPTTNAPKFAEALFHTLPREILREICQWLPFYNTDWYFDD